MQFVLAAFGPIKILGGWQDNCRHNGHAVCIVCTHIAFSVMLHSQSITRYEKNIVKGISILKNKHYYDNLRVNFQNQTNPLLVLVRKTDFFDGIYTHVYGKTKFRFKKMYLRELSGSKFHSVTSSNVILYIDVKNSTFIKSGFSNVQTFLWII